MKIGNLRVQVCRQTALNIRRIRSHEAKSIQQIGRTATGGVCVFHVAARLLSVESHGCPLPRRCRWRRKLAKGEAPAARLADLRWVAADSPEPPKGFPGV